jgi:hypothetical protein
LARAPGEVDGSAARLTELAEHCPVAGADPLVEPVGGSRSQGALQGGGDPVGQQRQVGFGRSVSHGCANPLQ